MKPSKNIIIDVFTDPISLKRHRHTKSGHVYNPSMNDMKDFYLMAKPFVPKKPLEGSLKMTFYFVFKRPKKHYRSGKYSDQLKPKSPLIHQVKPDLSNVVKFYEDALGLTKFFYHDDKQISYIKGYKFYGKQGRVKLIIEEISDETLEDVFSEHCCSHSDKEYQPEEKDTNTPESYVCLDCNANLELLGEDVDIQRDEAYEEFGTWIDMEKS
tara:strand:+ start:702 stop:1337 length:636 start_codon:yes stop_codon:yes gene_type:complete